MEPVRIGLIGCGRIGQKHLQALVHLEDAKLVATCDVELERAAGAAVAFDAEAYDDPARLLEREDLEAVVVATPSGTHPDLVRMALARGVHVLVEKPLALTYAQAKAVVDEAQAAGVLMAVTHFNRLLPAVARSLEAFHQGRMGRMVAGEVSVLWSRPQSYYDEAAWRGTRAMDGGVLFNQAIHALDVLLQFMGQPRAVQAYAATLTHRIEAEDTVAGAVRFESGALATVTATTSVAQSNVEERITLVGDQGVVIIGPTVRTLEMYRVEEEDEDTVRREIEQLPARTGWQSHWDALSEFVAAIRTGSPLTLSAASCLPAIGLVEALTQSALKGREVSWREVTGAGRA